MYCVLGTLLGIGPDWTKPEMVPALLGASVLVEEADNKGVNAKINKILGDCYNYHKEGKWRAEI